MPTAFIIEDHPLTRFGIRSMLSTHDDILVVGEAESGEEGLRWLESNRADLVTVDLSLPDLTGFEVIARIHDQHPDSNVLVISHYEQASCAGRALREGARGFLGKSEPAPRLLEAVERVLDGGIFVSETIQNNLLRGLMEDEPNGHSPLEVLSNRELDVFEMTGEGLGTREIAERLNLSVKTVESYRRRVRAKLELPTNPRLVQEAVRWVESRSQC